MSRMTQATALQMQDLLRERPRSVAELMAATGLNDQAVRRWVRSVRDLGYLHISSYTLDVRGRMHAPVLSWGPGTDAARPGQRRTPAERMKALRAARKEQK